MTLSSEPEALAKLLYDLIEAVGGVEAVTRLLLARAAAKEALNARDKCGGSDG